MIRRPPRSTQSRSSAASDVYKRQLTYRSPAELESRFARLPGEGETFAIQSYLTHHGAKLVARFEVQSYLALLGAMDAHDVGRGRRALRVSRTPRRRGHYERRSLSRGG